MNQDKNVKDLLSVCFRKWRAIFIGMLLTAALIGGYKGVSLLIKAQKEANSKEDFENQYNKELGEYQARKKELEKKIEKKQKYLQSAREYLDESLLANIDPYNAVVTVIVFSITDIDEEAFDRTFEAETVPVEYLTNVILDQYLALWDTTDVSEVIDSLEDNDAIQEKYLREVITVQKKVGGLIYIGAIADSTETSKIMAETVYGFLENNQPLIAKSTYGHGFTRISTSTTTVIDEDLENRITEQESAIENAERDIESLGIELEELEEPQKQDVISLITIAKKVLVFALAGFLAGGLVMVVFIMMQNLFSGEISGSREIERLTNLSFLGNLVIDGKGLSRLAGVINKERYWQTKEQASGFVLKKLESMGISDCRVVFLSDDTHKKADDTIGQLISFLNENKVQASYVADYFHNADADIMIQKSDYVVLTEHILGTTTDNMLYLKKVCDKLQRPVKGFILY